MVWQWQRYRDRRQRRHRRNRDYPPDLIPVEPAVQAVEQATDLTQAPVERRGEPLDDPAFLAGLRPIPAGSPGTPAPWSAADIVGVSPSGDPMEIRIDGGAGHLLLAFLNTDCDGCEEFWRGFRDPDALGLPFGVSSIVITKGPGSLSSAEVALSANGIERVPVVMSDQAWIDYRVLGYPFFVLVDVVLNQVVGETVGLGWDDVIAMTGTAR
jgi:hypothetical protein